MGHAFDARSRLQAARQEAGLRQEEVARALEAQAGKRGRPRVVTAQTVCDWEAGRRLTLDVVVLLCAYWGRSAEELGLIPDLSASQDAAGDSGPNGPTNEDSGAADPERRQVLQALGTTAAGMLVDAADESARLSQRQEASDLGPATLEHLDLAVERFGLDYLHVPPDLLFQQVRRSRRQVTELLEGRHTLSQQRHLYVLAGWLSGLLGHLSLDQGDGSAARSPCVTAGQLAREAGHGALLTWVRGTQMMVAVYTGRAHEAVALVRPGLEAAPTGSTAAVRLAAQAARAHARLGDRDGTDAALADARNAADALVERPDRSIFSFDLPYLPFYAGTSYVWLGQAEAARTHAQEAIALCDAAPANWPVARALARIDLATALTLQGEPDQACRVAVEALRIHTEERTVALVPQRTAEPSEVMRPHRALPAVRDLNERLHELHRHATLRELPARRYPGT